MIKRNKKCKEIDTNEFNERMLNKAPNDRNDNDGETKENLTKKYKTNYKEEQKMRRDRYE